ncbi:MAG TPA: molybdopterin-binding protein, partial [Caldilineaceae bacterium]|nr:molybdopterin-binding protein [Caldilineaceae bacterium]
MSNSSQAKAPERGLAAEVITIGTEILLGDIVDTNAAWIAQQLREVGINLYYKTTVGDNEARARAVIELGLSRSDILIVTGGLGPT